MISTKRLHIRLVRESDARDLFRLIESNRERLKNDFPITTGSIFDLSSTQRYIKNKIGQFVQKSFFYYILIHRKEQKIIGCVMIKDFDWRVPKGEMAYFLAADYEGQGLMQEGANAVIEKCFEQLELTRLLLRIVPENTRSIALAERLGFEKEGHLKQAYRNGDGHLSDMLYFGRLKG